MPEHPTNVPPDDVEPAPQVPVYLPVWAVLSADRTDYVIVCVHDLLKSALPAVGHVYFRFPCSCSFSLLFLLCVFHNVLLCHVANE